MSSLSRERLEALDRALPWAPQPGPQLAAYTSLADQLLYGGAAGGGKTALGIGLALTAHRRTLFIRREATQLLPVVDEVAGLLGSRDGFNGSDRVWRLPGGRTIQFGGVPNLGDESRFQGNARDLLVLDEAANLLEEQARFLLGWLRSTDRAQRCRALLCSNPPTSAEGEWLVRWFAPWLDPTFPNPAGAGELRWVAMLDGEERWVDGPAPILHHGERIQPVSRTFIPSRIQDNAYLRDSGYLRQLQALPEPLRSQMLNGDFLAGRSDDEWACIPSAWVKAAMDRWAPPPANPAPLTALGLDPSRGGDDTIIAPRRGWHFDPVILVPTSAASSGGGIAAAVLKVLGDDLSAVVHADVIGYGASACDHLEAYLGTRLVPVNFAAGSDERDQTGNLRFANVRAQAWWRMRELLAPEHLPRLSLPRDPRLLADLTAPRYRLTARGIQIEDKADVKRRLGRSPDRGDAVVLAALRVLPVFDVKRHRRRHRQ